MWQSRAAPRVEVPRPVQLGSLKSENEGQDPGIRLVPAGGGGWGRKKEEDVIEEEEEVPETQNPRLGNLTSQPAQLRPTAWGRSSLSAQAGPRPAPWAQPPPGKVVPEPVPLERRQQEDFPSLGSEPIKGRKSSGSGPSMLSAPVSRPIGAPVPRANLQDRPVAAERREALERREREAAERAAQAPGARPAEKAPEPRPEPRSEKVPSDPEDQADKDKELMKNLADKRRAEKKEEEEERARQQFERAQEKLRLLEKRARERERMEEEERQEQLRALREGPRVQPEPKVSEATPVHEVVEPELPPRQMREAPRMEIHVPMPEAPAPRVEVNLPMPEVPEPREAHMPSSVSSGRRLPPPPMQQPPPPSAPSVVQMSSAPRAPVSVWGDTMAPPAASPAIGGHFPDLGGVPAQSKKDKQKAAFAANLAEPKSSAPSWGQAQRAPPTFTLQELAKPAKKGRSAKVFGGKADADEQALTGAFQQPAPVPGPAMAEPQVPEPSQVPQAWQGDVARRQEMPRHEGLWEDRARPQEGRSRGKGQGREGTAWQTGDRGDRGDRNARFGRREGREDRRERERNERVPRSEIRLEKRDDGSRRDRDEKDLAEASPSHEEEVRTFKIDPQKPVRILQKSPEEKAKEKAPEPVEQPVLKAEDKGKGKASKKGKGQKGRGRGPRVIGEDSDAEWSEASASDEEKPKPGRAELVASEEDSEGGEGTFAASVPKGKGKAKGKNKGKEKAKGAGKKGWVRVEREEKDEEQDEEEEREEIEARLRNSRKVLESRALARAEAERQRRLLREKASLPAPAAPAEPESFQTPECSEHEAEKEEPEEFQEAASEPAELDVADEEPVPDVPDVPDSRPLPELEAEPADEEGVEAEAELDDSIEVEEMEGDASPLSKEEEAEAEADEDDEEPPVPRGSVLSQEAVHRLNPVADTGLALGIGMVAVQQEAQEEVDSDDLLDFETVKNKTERKAEKQTQRRVKEEHATRAAIRKEAQRQRVRAKEQRETEAAEEKAAEAAAARQAAQAAGPKHEVIKLSDLRRTQPQPQPPQPVASVEEAQAPVYQVQTDMVYQVRAEAPYPSGKPPPYKPPDVRHLVVSILKANSATMSKPHGGGYHPTEPSTYPGHEGKSYGDRDGWETWSPEDWMQDDWEVPIEDPKEERRRQAAAAAAEWNQHRRTRRHAAHGAHATSTWG